MAQKREKDETLELKVPSESPLSSLSSPCPDTNCKISPGSCAGPDPTRMDLKRKAAARRPRSEELSPEAAEPPPTRAAGSDEDDEAATAPPKKKAVNRCSGCGKRVGLTGFRCRCGDLFCSEHRYSDRHDCSYDYKAVGREAIARENPVVRAAKILKV